jgi:hypothetical protein
MLPVAFVVQHLRDNRKTLLGFAVSRPHHRIP